MKLMIKRAAQQLGIDEVTPMMGMILLVLILIPFPIITIAALVLFIRRFLKK